MADRVERMMENQRKREEDMKKREAERIRKEEEEKNKKLEALKSKLPQSGPSAASGARDTPVELENFMKLRKNFYAPLPKTERGKPVLLGGDPVGDNILYCNGNDIIIRNLRNPLEGDIYTEHPRPTTVARYSPDGQFIASADITGTIRIWNTKPVQGIPFKLESEKPVIAGAITDLSWDPEGKRMVAVGAGKEVFGAFFFVQGGASAGTVTGHSKTITTCDFRPIKPFRAVTASEDLAVSWFEGPPFKWKYSQTVHERFPNCVRFSPDGSLFCSVGQDKIAWLGNGETGEKKSVFESSHSGGIYACSWNKEGNRILTSSGDKTCKIWDVSTGKAVTTFQLGSDVEDQQVGCLWQGEFLVSLALAGHFSYLDPKSGKVVKVIQGHQKEIKSVTYHPSSKTLYTGCYTSRVTRWNVDTGDSDLIGGEGHKNSVINMEAQGDDIHSASFDDTYRITKAGSDYSGSATTLGSRPYSMSAAKNAPKIAVVGTYDNKIKVLKDGKIVAEKAVDYRPQAVAISSDGSKVAVGGDNKEVELYNVSGNSLTDAGKFPKPHLQPITAIAFSRDGKYLASADKAIFLWTVADKKLVTDKLAYHTAKVNSLEFSPNSQLLGSVSLDTALIVWDLNSIPARCHIKAAHHGSANDVAWVDDKTVATVGADSSLKTWNFSFDS